MRGSWKVGKSNDADVYDLAAYRLDAYVPERLVDEMYSGRALLRLLGKKVRRRLPVAGAPMATDSIAAHYGSIGVFDHPEHHKGGLAFGRDFPRALNELGIGRCQRLCEFCAGPGYIGYSLFAAGWCQDLVLTDIDADAVALARRTAAYNGLEDRVTGYESDVLDAIPPMERWNMVVANPPHFLPDAGQPESRLRFDPDWGVHRRFYGSIKRHMAPEGLVVMVENAAGSDPDLFAEMIHSGGGDQLTQHPGTDIHGAPNGLYYQVSRW
jgi:Methyltransferase small domain